MATSPVTPAVPGGPVPVEVEKTYRYFDLDTFDEKSEKVTITFTPAGTYADALGRIGSDEKIALEAINGYLQRMAFREKKREVAAKGAPKRIVLNVIKPFRALPPWDGMSEDRPAQTKAILEAIRSNAVMVNAIKAASLKAAESGEEDEGDEE